MTEMFGLRESLKLVTIIVLGPLIWWLCMLLVATPSHVKVPDQFGDQHFNLGNATGVDSPKSHALEVCPFDPVFENQQAILQVRGSTMRMFHNLAFDTKRTDLENVCAYELGDFYAGTFSKCQRFDSKLPANAKLWVGKGEPTDSMANPLGWLIFSEKLIAIVEAFARDDLQLLPVPLFYVDSKKPVKGYRLVNVLRSVSALDLEQSVKSEMTIHGKQIVNVIKPTFRDSAIPLNVHIFRAKESPFKVTISDELAQAMVGKVVGVALIRTKTSP